MKIILSRKGFDSSAGGIPRPIFPDGRLFSFPIPFPGEPITFAQVELFNSSAAMILNDLCPSGYRFNEEAAPRPWSAVPAHLDPDLRADTLPRNAGWRPLFGQDGAAQGHLSRCGVGEGDLFLFFGWFRQTMWEGGRLVYTPTAPDLHLVFGWLEVGEVWHVGAPCHDVPGYAAYHPHVIRNYGHTNNSIYVAARGGAFSAFDPRLQLTECGASRSVWRLPAWFYPTEGRPPLTYHKDPRRWTLGDGHTTLRSVGKGQEFVFDVDHYPEALAWAQDILAVPRA